MVELYEHQKKALEKLDVGKILCGGVGSGKTLTSLHFFRNNYRDHKLFVITTAKKRDDNDWQDEIKNLGLKGIVDSWNNITKYINEKDSFFIFDEQRVVGYSVWSKSFIKITKNNKWILLSATPGDTWMDYIPVFIANGFYRNKTEFTMEHVEYDPYVSFPKIKRYHNEAKLMKLRNSILIPMEMERHTTRHRKVIYSSYDIDKYDVISRNRWNIFENKPIENASELLQCLRRVISSDEDRIFNAKVLMDMNRRIIVYYNYNYELEILKTIATELNKPFAEWNGHKHEQIPSGSKWIYLVQYTAGAEGWNCTKTNTMLFYSMNYSYRVMEQCEGRIDRLNTPFIDLEYYILSSRTKLDSDIYKTIQSKKKFNIAAWARKSGAIF